MGLKSNLQFLSYVKVMRNLIHNKHDELIILSGKLLFRCTQLKPANPLCHLILSSHPVSYTASKRA
jgi:hypothetical protein